MPKQVSGSRSMSSSEPVNVIAGWIASGMQPRSVSGASTPTPLAPDVCTTMVPGRTASVAASPDTSPDSSASGTASSNNSARPATSSTGSTAVSGSRRCARCRDACEMALQATTTCSARSSATPSAVPTRPAEMMPTVSRAGRNPSGVPTADDLAECQKSVFVPVLRCGYRTVGKRLYHSSRRRRRPPPAGVACSLRQQLGNRLPPGGLRLVSAAMPRRGFRLRRRFGVWWRTPRFGGQCRRRRWSTRIGRVRRCGVAAAANVGGRSLHRRLGGPPRADVLA